jgi:hypothetical protein
MLTRNRLLVEVERTMRLSALRWSVAGALEPEKKRAARTDGTFLKKYSENKWSKPAAHSTLEDIAKGESEMTLKLVIGQSDSDSDSDIGSDIGSDSDGD